MTHHLPGKHELRSERVEDKLVEALSAAAVDEMWDDAACLEIVNEESVRGSSENPAPDHVRYLLRIKCPGCRGITEDQTFTLELSLAAMRESIETHKQVGWERLEPTTRREAMRQEAS